MSDVKFKFVSHMTKNRVGRFLLARSSLERDINIIPWLP